MELPPLDDHPPLGGFAPPTYPAGYSPYVAHGVDLNSPGTVFLDVPGAAAPVYVKGAETGEPTLYVGMYRGKPDPFGGKVSVPLLDGRRATLKWIENWSGYPVVTLEGKEIFRLPAAPAWDRVVMVVCRLVPLVLGLLPGYFIGIYMARWVATMVKRGDSKVKRRLGPLAVAIGPFVFLALFILVAVLASNAGSTQSN